jgi:hypothetical protein
MDGLEQPAARNSSADDLNSRHAPGDNVARQKRGTPGESDGTDEALDSRSARRGISNAGLHDLGRPKMSRR